VDDSYSQSDTGIPKVTPAEDAQTCVVAATGVGEFTRTLHPRAGDRVHSPQPLGHLRPPATKLAIAATLNDFDFGKREDHAPAGRQELRLPLQDALLEVPGQYKKVVRLHRPRLVL
jgi:hypothetical protein